MCRLNQFDVELGESFRRDVTDLYVVFPNEFTDKFSSPEYVESVPSSYSFTYGETNRRNGVYSSYVNIGIRILCFSEAYVIHLNVNVHASVLL